MTFDGSFKIPEYTKPEEKKVSSALEGAGGWIVFSIMAAAMLGLLLVFHKHHVITREGYVVAILSVNIMAMFICLAVYLSFIMSRSFNKTEDKATIFFMIVWPLLFFTMGFDSITYAIEGRAELRVWGDISNFAVYSSAMATSIVYWYYIANEVDLSPKFKQGCTVFVNIVGMLFIMLMAVNHFTGWVFYISEDGYFSNGPYSFLTGATYINLFAAFIATLAAKNTANEKVIFVLVPAIPFVVGCLTDATRMELAYPAATISLGFVYSAVYEKRNVLYAQQQVEIEQRKSAVLNAQIKPHFINNCMQVILGLMDEKPAKAREAMEVFATYFRGSTNLINKVELVDFDEEMEFAQNYLYLQKLRFEDRFETVIDIQERDFKLPAFTIQPVVENAVKYAFIGRKTKGNVYIATRKTDKGFMVIVSDNGIGFNEADIEKDRKHVGLYNVQSRVRMMTGGDVLIESKPGEGTRIIIEIPKEIDKRRKIK